MSSALKSRDLNPSGTVPTVELGYPAVVLFTFDPSEKESTEISVSEGDIVQLLYSVGGWVFVRTYEGNVGYIPLNFCSELECSKAVGAVFQDDTGEGLPRTDPQTYDKPQAKSVNELLSFSASEAGYNGNLVGKYNHPGIDNRNYWNAYIRDDHVNKNLKTQRHTESYQNNPNIQLGKQFYGKTPSDNIKNESRYLTKVFSCAICNAFLSRFISGVQNLSITDKEKADLKSRKLLKLLQRATQEGLNLISNIRYLTGYNQSCCDRLKENCLTSDNDLVKELVPEFGANCIQCEILRDFFKLSEKYSMTDLYATIRDLHIHALSDSDSDADSGTHANLDVQCNNTGSSRRWASKNLKQPKTYKGKDEIKNILNPNELKRSVSFQLEEKTMIKNEIIRNNSFSGEMSLHKPEDAKDDESQNRESLHSGYSQKTIDSGIADIHDDLDSSFHSEQKSDTSEREVFLKDENSNLQEMKNVTVQNKSEMTGQNSNEPHGVYGFQALLHSKVPLSPRSPSLKSSQTATAKTETTVKRSDAFKQKSLSNFGKTLTKEPQSNQLNDSNTTIQPSVSKVSFSPRSLDKTKSSTDFDGTNTPLGQPTIGSTTLKPEKTVNVCEASTHLTAPVIRGSGKEEPDSTTDRRKILARRFQSMKVPSDMKHPADFLPGRREDKDIRKSIQDLNVKRTASVKNAPLRAQHSIPFQSSQKEGFPSAKTVLVKKSNKQMWRPPVGMPEGSDQRPFSPFGGTLPPSKINKKKVHEVFV